MSVQAYIITNVLRAAADGSGAAMPCRSASTDR